MLSLFRKARFVCLFLGVSLLVSSCTVVKIVDVAASTAIGVTVGAVKATGAVIGAAIPEDDEEE